MFKISIIDTRCKRRLVVEGQLVTPWVGELAKSWRSARQSLGWRKLVIDLSNVTVISRDGESALVDLIEEGAQFSCEGVFTTYLVTRLARDCRKRKGLTPAGDPVE